MRELGLVFAAVISVSACQPSGAPARSASSADPRAKAVRAEAHGQPTVVRANGWTQVPSRHVCMINDQHMGRDQIPVVVSGKTYFGCCAMCEAKLKNDAASRVAVDPVSGRTVDKATALIASSESGAVVYFENADNLQAYGSR